MIKKTVISPRFIDSIAYILVLTDNIVAGQFVGDDAVAAMTLVLPIFTMILFVAHLISDGLVMIASYAQGKGDRAEVDRLFSLGIILSICCGIIFFAGIIFADFLPAMFGVKDKILADEVAVAMRYFLPFTIFLGCTQMLGNYYIYIKKMYYGAFIKILMLLVLPYIGMTIGGQFSLNIFWLCVGISFAVSYLINFIFTRSRAGLLMIDKENLSRQISYDINATFDEVMALTKKFDDELTRRGVAEKVRNKIVLCVEEFGLHAVERAGKNIF